MAFAGSMTLKYATAFTLTGTLSLVITSCGGTSSVIVLKSTFTILSTKGIIKKIPGPFTPLNLPNLNNTPLSYSLSILTDARIRIISKMKNTTAIIIGTTIIGDLLVLAWLIN